jgi:hypothetical protein
MFSVCGRQYQAETLRTILALVSLISLIAISGHAQSDSGYSLSLSSTNIKAGEELTVSWTVQEGYPASQKDWIGLSNVTGPEPVWGDWWSYTDGAPIGSFKLRINAPGLYVLQYMLNDTYEMAVASDLITVTGNGAQPSLTDTIRFLEQSTFGPTPDLVRHVQNIGFEAFLEEQFNAPITEYPLLELRTAGIPSDCVGICLRDNYRTYPLQVHFYKRALYGEDQLRQRMAFALHKILVISGRDINLPSWMAPYLRILDQNAFGNYRQLLYEITLNPAMGNYLDLAKSSKNRPNENYARELMQLFTIGLFELNSDGTYKRDEEGELIPTYSQEHVAEFTRALTGWDFEQPETPGILNYIKPMRVISNNHDTGSKKLLNGVVIPAGQSTEKDLQAVLDNLFNHPNIGPFICKQLIQHLVTSNPSPEYVGRVAGVFNDNGQGERGDLKAVVKAILLDKEARGDNKNDKPNYGRLKDPVQYILNILRAFEARSFDGSDYSDGVISGSPINGAVTNFPAGMGQDLLRPVSVFYDYSPDNEVQGTDIIGPEFGILSTATMRARINFCNTIFFNGIPTHIGGGTEENPDRPNGTSVNLAPYVELVDNPEQLVGTLNALLTHNAMTSEQLNSVLNAVRAVPASKRLLRAQTAVYLITSSAQYQVQR